MLIRDWLILGICGCFLTTAGAFADDKKARENKAARTDLFGDPLPEGAIARLGTIRWRHNSPVFSLSFSPDGRTIASSCDDGQIHLWDRDTGKEIGRMGGERNLALRFPTPGPHVSFSHDGKTIASSGWPKEGVVLWNVADQTSTILGGDVQSLFSAFSPDGKLLAEKTDGFLRLWNLSTGKIFRRLEDHQTPISPPAYGLAFSPDSKIVASAGTDPIIRLWDISTGNILHQLTGHKENVAALAFSPDGKILVSAGWDSTVRAWAVNTGKEIRQFKGHGVLVDGIVRGTVYSAVISPDGKTVCSGSDDHSVRLWELATGREVRRFSIDAVNQLALAFSPDGKLIAAGGYDHIIHLWNPSTGKEEGSGADSSPLRWLAFLSGQTLISSCGSRLDNKFTFWDALTGKEKKIEAQLGEPEAWTVSPEGKILATCATEQSIQLWDISKNQKLRQVEPSITKVRSLALSLGGERLAAGGEGNVVQIWNGATGKEIRKLGRKLSKDHEWFVDYLNFSPDGAMLAVKRVFSPSQMIGNNPRDPSEMYFWDLRTGNESDHFRHFKEWCEWVVFSPDGKIVVTTARSSRYDLCFWEIATREKLRSIKGNKRFLTAIFSPNGRILAAGAEDGRVLLFDVNTGKMRRSLTGHRGPVHHLSFSDDGRLLASESSDGTGIIWDLQLFFAAEEFRLPLVRPRQLPLENDEGQNDP